MRLLVIVALCMSPALAQNLPSFNSGGGIKNLSATCGISGTPTNPIVAKTGGTVSRVPTVNLQSGASYAIASSDCGKTVELSASSATPTIAQAGSAGFLANWFTDLLCIGTGGCTLTPATSTINGAATLVLAQYQAAHLISDGTNYQALFIPPGSGPTTNQNIRTIGASFGSFQSGASALSAGATSCVPVYFSGTIKAVHLIANVSGSVTIDVQTVLHASWAGTASVSSITSSDTPALSSASAYTDTTLTGWTTTLAANTDVCFVMSAPTTIAGASITVEVAAN